MDTIVITLAPGNKNRIEISDYPELTSSHKLVSKSIAVLKQYAPGIMRYLSKQRLLGHLTACHVEVRGAGDMSLSEVRALLAGWMRRKRTRRLFYVILELLLMPFTASWPCCPGRISYSTDCSWCFISMPRLF